MASGASPNNAAEIDRLALALVKDPASKAFIPLAEEYGKAGMWAEAAGVLEDGLIRYPGFITAMVALGRVYDQLNQPAKAKAVLEDAVKASPENLRAHRTLAKLYAAEGAREAALRSCAVILAANPADQESLALRDTLDRAPKPDAAVPSTPATPAPKAYDPTPVAAAVPAAAAASTADASAPHTGNAPILTVSEPALDEHGNFVVVVAAPAEGAAEEGISDTAEAESVRRRQAAIVKLEAWLRVIQTRRRDRSASSETPRAANG